MKRIHIVITAFIFVLQSQAQMVDSNTPSDALPTNTFLGSNWTLDFSDEFEDVTVNTNKWNIDDSPKSRNPRKNIGINRWFWRPRSVTLNEGKLELNVEKADWQTMVCGSINTNNKYETTYGYYEARIKVAETAKGSHTAFWLQGDKMGKVDGTGNDGAEIDVFESAWLGDFTKSVVHIDGYGDDHRASTKKYTTPGIHTGYHTYGFYWTKEYMRIYYDGVLKVTYKDPKYIPQVDEYLWLSDGASFGLGDEPNTDVFFKDQPIGDLTKAYVEYIRGWKSTKTNIAGGKTVTVSSHLTSATNNYVGANLVDGNTTDNESRWISGSGDATGWAEIDLGQTYTVNGFRALSGFDGFNKPFQDFQFQYWDGTEWQNAYSKTNGDASIIEQYFDDVVTDKVRLNVTKNSESFIRLYELEVYGSTVLNVNGINLKKINLYPNPTSGEVFISNFDEEVDVQISDVKGSIVSTQKTKNKIDISSLKTGIYLVNIKGYKTEKIIKL